MKTTSPANPVVVASAGDPVTATLWVDALRDAGIPATAIERGPAAVFGGATATWSTYQVMVDRSRFAAARNVIAGLDGAADLAPLRDSGEAERARVRALLTVFGLIGAIIAAAVLARIVS